MAAAYPEAIPASRAEYDCMLHQTAGFIRNNSFIAPHKFGTLEFRTACGQANLTSIPQLVILRLVIWKAVKHGARSHVTEPKDHFYRVCLYSEKGLASVVHDDINDLLQLLTGLSKGYSRHLQPLLARAKYRCEEAQQGHLPGRPVPIPEDLTI
ncbi:hypothetical protein [Arsenicibacter rosenii]|uniref:Uncharacterized protein n=1 Tax=Arsenicibacter rosenii TaxID=1750698 RepID=A0A1S2VBA5_9BACT|nr:hypothetical protein [Arsenicibacter rosenii]OIN55496.1 hypothetical protein BLX24_30030 [Arsenicibacter rosenii]